MLLCHPFDLFHSEIFDLPFIRSASSIQKFQLAVYPFEKIQEAVYPFDLIRSKILISHSSIYVTRFERLA